VLCFPMVVQTPTDWYIFSNPPRPVPKCRPRCFDLFFPSSFPLIRQSESNTLHSEFSPLFSLGEDDDHSVVTLAFLLVGRYRGILESPLLIPSHERTLARCAEVLTPLMTRLCKGRLVMVPLFTPPPFLLKFVTVASLPKESPGIALCRCPSLLFPPGSVTRKYLPNPWLFLLLAHVI